MWLKTLVGKRLCSPTLLNTKNTDAIEHTNSVLMCWKTTQAAKMLLWRRKMGFVGPVMPSNFKSSLKKRLLLAKPGKVPSDVWR